MSTLHVPHAHLRRPHLDGWLVAVVALSALVVALGAWIVVDRTTSSSTEQGLAPPEVVTMLRNRITAFNTGNAKAVAAFYAPDAVLEERDVTPAVVTRGSVQIGRRIQTLVQSYGMQLRSASPVIQFGRAVAEGANVPLHGYESTGWILVYRLAANGKIAHQWVLPAE